MTIRLTPEGYEKLKNELEDLTNNSRPEVAKKLKEASEGKDFEDNPELEAVRMEQSFVEGRIQELSILLGSAEILTDSQAFDTAELGAYVSIKFDDGETESYRLVSPAEANPLEGKISVQSPLGKAISGRKASAKVTVHAPDGSFEVEITSINDSEEKKLKNEKI